MLHYKNMTSPAHCF